MQYKQLGTSDLQVSDICLGTMTFGQQTSLEDAHDQLDYAIAQGINFIDSAEMYPVPARSDTQGKTEDFIGSWLVKQPRDRLIIATKVAGPSRNMPWLRQGPRAIDRQNVIQAVEDSLRRLQTDYIDLYQIHWPDRSVPLFGQTQFDPSSDRPTIPIEEQLTVFAELVQAGKIRYIGVSNETPWGVCQFCTMADRLGLPRIVSIQNAYNLLNRVFEVALAETCYREHVGLLAYSPLAFGSLTGKYLNQEPPEARLTLFPGFGGRYRKPYVEDAVREYVAIAQQHNLSPARLAIAFIRSRWFVSSVIVGARTIDQLKENLDAASLTLEATVLNQIDQVHARYPNPAP